MPGLKGWTGTVEFRCKGNQKSESVEDAGSTWPFQLHAEAA